MRLLFCNRLHPGRNQLQKVLYILPVFIAFMTTIEEHLAIIKELEEDINEKIRAGLLLRRQKIIVFSTSESATNYFALLLHKKNLIPSGFNVNHLWFVSEKKAYEHYPADFPSKKEIISLLVKQEDLRQKLCYGKDKDLSLVEEAVRNFFKLKKLVEKELGEEL